MRWIKYIVILYFLGLLGLFYFGLGKIASLMFSEGWWSFVKDSSAICAAFATCLALYLAVKTYMESDRQRRFLVAKDALSTIKNHLSELNGLVDKRWEINDAFYKFENRLSFLSLSDQAELTDELSAFSKTLLRKVLPHHIFPIALSEYIHGYSCEFGKNQDGNVIGFETADDGFRKTLDASAKILYKCNFVNNLQGKYFLKTADGAYDVLLKILQSAQPYVYAHCIARGRDMTFEDFKRVAASLGYVSAAFIYLNSATARHELFDGIVELIKFDKA